MLDPLEPLTIARTLIEYTILDTYKVVASTLLASAIVSSLTTEPKKEKKEIEEMVAKALMLPYPVKSMKVEGNKIIIEIGEEK
mgnify:CR=1 FL=1